MALTSSGSLQRSAISFRRQGSSGVVWDDRFVSGDNDRSQRRFYSGELSRPNKSQQQQQQQRSSDSSRPHLNDDLNSVNPPVNLRPIKTVRSDHHQGSSNNEITDPPSPRLKGCGACCGGLGKSPRSGRASRPVRSRPR